MWAKRRDQRQQTKTWQASGRELIGRDGIQLSPTKSDQQTLDYLLWKSRTPGQLSLLPPPSSFFWQLLILLCLFSFLLSDHRLIKGRLVSLRTVEQTVFFFSFPSTVGHYRFSHKPILLAPRLLSPLVTDNFSFIYTVADSDSFLICFSQLTLMLLSGPSVHYRGISNFCLQDVVSGFPLGH